MFLIASAACLSKNSVGVIFMIFIFFLVVGKDSRLYRTSCRNRTAETVERADLLFETRRRIYNMPTISEHGIKVKDLCKKPQRSFFVTDNAWSGRADLCCWAVLWFFQWNFRSKPGLHFLNERSLFPACQWLQSDGPYHCKKQYCCKGI